MAAPAPRDTEDTRGRRWLHIPTHTLPPPPPVPVAARRFRPVPGRRGPAAAARKPRGAPGRRWRPGGGAGAATLEQSGDGERRGRRGEGRHGEILWFAAVLLRLPSETGRGWRSRRPGGAHPGQGSPRGLNGTQKEPLRVLGGTVRAGSSRGWVCFVG